MLKLVLYSHIRTSAFNNFADLHVKRLLSVNYHYDCYKHKLQHIFSVELGRFKEADKHAYLYAV